MTGPGNAQALYWNGTGFGDLGSTLALLGVAGIADIA